MYFSISFIQIKLKDDYNIILPYLDADLEEVLKRFVETSVKSESL